MATAAAPGTILDQPSLSDRFRPSPNVVWARHTDATVLLDVDRGLYYTLNDAAGRIWELLVAGEPVIEILHCLTDEYAIDADTLRSDVTRLIGDLLSRHLIEQYRQ